MFLRNCSSLNEDKETYVHAYGRWNGPAAAIPTVENVYTNVLDGIKATLEKEEVHVARRKGFVHDYMM